MLAFSESVGYDGLSLAGLVRRKEVTPAELPELAIARTEAIKPAIHGVVSNHCEMGRQAIEQG